MVVSVHVPKSAGTSFRRILGEICTARIWDNYGAIFTRQQARAELVPQGVSIIHGHFMADAFDELFPKRRLVTWVRHPVERLVSNYQHFLRAPDMRDDCCRELHERGLSLRQFADLGWMRNETSRYLAQKPVEDFAFVGIAERFSESIQNFCRIFGFRDVLRIPHENVNPNRREEHYDLPAEDYAYILERNAADFAWYNSAVGRLAEELGPDSQRVA